MPNWISDKTFLARVVKLEKVVVLFTAPSWCVPCQKFAPHFERAASEVEDILLFAVDIDDNPWVVSEYDIKAAPTVKLYENGIFVRDVAPQGAVPFIRDIRS